MQRQQLLRAAIKPQPVIQSVLRLMKPQSATDDAPEGGVKRKVARPVRPRTKLPLTSDAPDNTPLGVVVRASLSSVSAASSSTNGR